MGKLTWHSVLVVCLGNICRSPMAHGLFEHHARQQGIAVAIDSAGCAGFHIGKPPDRRAIETARRNAIDIAHLRARHVDVGDFDRFDEIYAMDEQNLAELRSLRPRESTARLDLVMSLLSQDLAAIRSVPDPYYGDQAGFDQVFTMLDQAASRWAKQIAMGAQFDG